jgi:hypothetical protein
MIKNPRLDKTNETDSTRDKDTVTDEGVDDKIYEEEALDMLILLCALYEIF